MTLSVTQEAQGAPILNITEDATGAWVGCYTNLPDDVPSLTIRTAMSKYTFRNGSVVEMFAKAETVWLRDLIAASNEQDDCNFDEDRLYAEHLERQAQDWADQDPTYYM